MSETVAAERETDTAPDDIRSSLRAAIAAQETPDEAPPPAKAETALADAPEKPVERARGPDGKFVRADEAGAEEAPQKAAADGPASDQQKPPAEDGAPKTDSAGKAPEDPPALSNWKLADREMYRQLPKAAQEFVLRRETERDAEFTRKSQQLAQLRSDYEPVAQMFAPHAEQMRARGLTPSTLIQAWANVEQRLMNGDGVNVLRGLVDGYRIPVDQLVAALGYRPPATAAAGDQQPPAPQPDVPVVHPQVAQELAQVRQWINTEAQRQQYQAQQMRAFEANRIASEIDQFRSAVDSATGQPLHPYFPDVEADMAAMVQGYRGQGMPVPPLSELYDRAVYSNPSTRAALQQAQAAAAEAQRAAAEAKAKADARAKAESARRAGSSITGAPGGAPQSTARRGEGGSVRDALRAAMEEQAI